MEKVKEIYSAKRMVYQLEAKYKLAMRKRQLLQAMRAKSEARRIRQSILRKYDIIL